MTCHGIGTDARELRDPNDKRAPKVLERFGLVIAVVGLGAQSFVDGSDAKGDATMIAQMACIVALLCPIALLVCAAAWHRGHSRVAVWGALLALYGTFTLASVVPFVFRRL